MDWSECLAVERDPQKLSGAWIFRGTRLTVQTLFDNSRCGRQRARYLRMVWRAGSATPRGLAIRQPIAVEGVVKIIFDQGVLRPLRTWSKRLTPASRGLRRGSHPV
jgi:Protein of unknown function (DUF433)